MEGLLKFPPVANTATAETQDLLTEIKVIERRITELVCENSCGTVLSFKEDLPGVVESFATCPQIVNSLK